MIVRAQRWLRSWTVAHRFTTLTRWLIAAAFIPSGAKKIAGVPFTAISSDTPIGGFFEAFFQAHEYYAFVGLAQVAAALLLLWRSTALLGALLFLPIISNIAVITWSMHFRGTGFVTAALLLANVYLLFWDADRLRVLLDRDATIEQRAALQSLNLPRAAMATAAFGVAGLAAGAILFAQPGATAGAFLLVVGAALLPLCLACAWETLAVARAARMKRQAAFISQDP